MSRGDTYLSLARRVLSCHASGDMQRGWKANGLIRPLWQNYPGGRDGLARAIGSSGSVLSAINSGSRNLGLGLGQRLAAERGVTLLELGAPLSYLTGDRTLVDRLESLEAKHAELRRMVLEGFDAVRNRLEALESPDEEQRTPRRR